MAKQRFDRYRTQKLYGAKPVNKMAALHTKIKGYESVLPDRSLRPALSHSPKIKGEPSIDLNKIKNPEIRELVRTEIENNPGMSR